MVNIQVLPYRMEVHAIAMTQYCSLLKLALEDDLGDALCLYAIVIYPQ